MLGPGPVGIGEEQVSFGVEIEIVRPFEQLIVPRIDQCLQLFSLWIVGQNATVPRGQIEFPVVPPSALGLAGLPETVGPFIGSTNNSLNAQTKASTRSGEYPAAARSMSEDQGQSGSTATPAASRGAAPRHPCVSVSCRATSPGKHDPAQKN